MLNSMQRATVVQEVPRKHTAHDPTDAFLLDLAEFVAIGYLVTGDKQSGLLKKCRIAGARILTAANFCATVLR
jgi:predicted nucleic acid-binding protein